MAIASSSFGMGCGVEVVHLLGPSQMVNLGPLVPELNAFHGAWHLRLRAGFIPLDEHDYEVLNARLSQESTSLWEAVGAYLALARQREDRPASANRPSASSR